MTRFFSACARSSGSADVSVPASGVSGCGGTMLLRTASSTLSRPGNCIISSIGTACCANAGLKTPS